MSLYYFLNTCSPIYYKGVTIVINENDDKDFTFYVHRSIKRDLLDNYPLYIAQSSIRKIRLSLPLSTKKKSELYLLLQKGFISYGGDIDLLKSSIDKLYDKYSKEFLQTIGSKYLSWISIKGIKEKSDNIICRIGFTSKTDIDSDSVGILFANTVSLASLTNLYDLPEDWILPKLATQIARKTSFLGAMYHYDIIISDSLFGFQTSIVNTEVDSNPLDQLLEAAAKSVKYVIGDGNLIIDPPMEDRKSMNVDMLKFEMLPKDIAKTITSFIKEDITMIICASKGSYAYSRFAPV